MANTQPQATSPSKRPEVIQQPTDGKLEKAHGVKGGQAQDNAIPEVKDSEGTITTSTFTLFPDLAIELRLKIWKLSTLSQRFI
jgi:hypothetical protein